MRNLQFVQSAILELLEKQLIQVHDSPPHCVNPLTVVEGKKLRLIWLNPNFVMKICDLRAKFLNRGFGSIHRTFNKVTIMWIFFNLISNFLAFRGINWMFYVYSSPIWIELCMFLFYQAIAPFSKEMVVDVPQLFCVFR